MMMNTIVNQLERSLDRGKFLREINIFATRLKFYRMNNTIDDEKNTASFEPFL